jgi:hypothetical protein
MLFKLINHSKSDDFFESYDYDLLLEDEDDDDEDDGERLFFLSLLSSDLDLDRLL